MEKPSFEMYTIQSGVKLDNCSKVNKKGIDMLTAKTNT